MMIRIGKKSLTMSLNRSTVWDEVDDFLTSTPTPQDIIDFQLSDAARERYHQLIQLSREGHLNPDERIELYEHMAVETFLKRLKLRAVAKHNPTPPRNGPPQPQA
jgi:hypothetical protein